MAHETETENLSVKRREAAARAREQQKLLKREKSGYNENATAAEIYRRSEMIDYCDIESGRKGGSGVSNTVVSQTHPTHRSFSFSPAITTH